MSVINVYLGRQREVTQRTHLANTLFVLNNEQQVFHFVNGQDSSTWTDTPRKGLRIVLLVRNPPYPLATYMYM